MANTRQGAIYDLGYQRYEGVRLGRRHAVWAVYTQSLRVIFGIGRSIWAKLPAFGVLGLASLPAMLQAGVAAISTENVELVEHYDYYGMIEILLAIFCALMAPELIGRDQRTKTLSLYFSRALRREDYVLARYAAFATALLTLTLVPQFIMFAGNVAASTDSLDYLSDRWDDPLAIVASAVLLSCLVSGISMIVAASTDRRAWATAGIVAVFLLASAIAAAVFEAAGPEGGRFALLLSPFHVARGLTFWVFNVAPDPAENEQLFEADFFGGVYALVAVAVAAIALTFVISRYRGINA